MDTENYTDINDDLYRDRYSISREGKVYDKLLKAHVPLTMEPRLSLSRLMGKSAKTITFSLKPINGKKQSISLIDLLAVTFINPRNVPLSKLKAQLISDKMDVHLNNIIVRL